MSRRTAGRSSARGGRPTLEPPTFASENLVSTPGKTLIPLSPSTKERARAPFHPRVRRGTWHAAAGRARPTRRTQRIGRGRAARWPQAPYIRHHNLIDRKQKGSTIYFRLAVS